MEYIYVNNCDFLSIHNSLKYIVDNDFDYYLRIIFTMKFFIEIKYQFLKHKKVESRKRRKKFNVRNRCLRLNFCIQKLCVYRNILL